MPVAGEVRTWPMLVPDARVIRLHAAQKSGARSETELKQISVWQCNYYLIDFL
jgi:hypothetical protein